jgi:hypothetical protein
MSIIEEIYDYLNNSNNIHRTSKKCVRTDRIILKAMEFYITNLSLYKKLDLKLKLIVKQGTNEVDWIMIKKINN